jgi:hypothetical protein
MPAEVTMSYGTFFRRESRGILWEVLLALIFGAFVFAILALVTGDLLVNLIPTVGAMALFAVCHYFLWGQVAWQEVAPERRKEEARARLQPEQVKPSDELSQALDERERVELMSVLERSLRDNSPGDGRSAQQKETIREVLDRLHGFGA